jgi:hypothetical protein
MGRSCKPYADLLFGAGTRCDMNLNVSIEAANIIARWRDSMYRSKGLPLRHVGLAVLTFRLRMAHGYICG